MRAHTFSTIPPAGPVPPITARCLCCPQLCLARRTGLAWLCHQDARPACQGTARAQNGPAGHGQPWPRSLCCDHPGTPRVKSAPGLPVLVPCLESLGRGQAHAQDVTCREQRCACSGAAPSRAVPFDPCIQLPSCARSLPALIPCPLLVQSPVPMLGTGGRRLQESPTAGQQHLFPNPLLHHPRKISHLFAIHPEGEEETDPGSTIGCSPLWAPRAAKICCRYPEHRIAWDAGQVMLGPSELL